MVGQVMCQAARTGAGTPARALIPTLLKGRGPVTNPTDDLPPEPQSWRLLLDEGEGMEVRLTDKSDDEPAPFEVALFMSAARASDLSEVLGAYSGILAIAQKSAEVSSTEDSLQRALRDAARAVRGSERGATTPAKIGDGARLKAMEVLQQARPELNHSAVISIIDAVVWWLNDKMDYMAMDLLTAVHEDVGMTV